MRLILCWLEVVIQFFFNLKPVSVLALLYPKEPTVDLMCHLTYVRLPSYKKLLIFTLLYAEI